MQFSSFVEKVIDNKWNVHGIEVHEFGHLTNTFGNTEKTRFPIYSVTKSILSIAVGIAADEGKIDLARSPLYYLPAFLTSELPAAQKEVLNALSLRRFMTMSVDGYPFRPEGDDWLSFSLRFPLESPQIPVFHYSNIPAYLTGVSLARAINENVYSYLDRKLFSVLEIDKPPYATCPSGYFYGASGMELTVHELSKIGLLMYQNGVWDHSRILSESYISLASSSLQPCREGGYGLYFWKAQNGYAMHGKWGQRCYIFPSLDRVVT